MNKKDVVIITAGRAATQIIDILSYNNEVRVVGCLDDGNPPFYCQDFNIPVMGKITEMKSLFAQGKFSHAIVGISTSISLRKKFFEMCLENNIPMVNAIHPSCIVCKKVSFGVGNVICADVHIGTLAKIGDNNFISAKNNIEHHNVWGSHNTTGPGVMTSGIVEVGNETKFGTGVFIEPFLKIGSNCIIGSKNVITMPIGDNMIMRTKLDSMPQERKTT
jgi:acetyltransferase-like isoleucine patch superfamily enzyme